MEITVMVVSILTPIFLAKLYKIIIIVVNTITYPIPVLLNQDVEPIIGKMVIVLIQMLLLVVLFVLILIIIKKNVKVLVVKFAIIMKVIILVF